MPLFLIPIFAWIAAWLGEDLVRRGIRKALYVSLSLAATAVFFGVIMAGMDSLTAVLPADGVEFAEAILPRNLTLCLSLIIGARIARYVYDWKERVTDKVTS